MQAELNCVLLLASRLCGIHPLMQSISMIMKTMDLREQKHISAGSKLDTFLGVFFWVVFIFL